MFFTKASLLLTLATGFAAATPVPADKLAVRHPEPVPAYPAPEVFPPVKERKRDINNLGLGGLGGGNNAQSLNLNELQLSAFEQNNFKNVHKTQVNIQEVNIQEVSDGVNTAVVEQVQQVLVVDQRNNWFNNRARRGNRRNNRNSVSTVMLVVQEIQVQVADNVGNVVQQQVFAQSEVVANVGRSQTETVMVFDKRQLIATQVLGEGGKGNGLQGIAGIGAGATAPVAGVAQATGVADVANVGNAANATQNVQLSGVKPSYSVVLDDPAAQVTDVAQIAQQVQAGSQEQDLLAGLGLNLKH